MGEMREFSDWRLPWEGYAVVGGKPRRPGFSGYAYGKTDAQLRRAGATAWRRKSPVWANPHLGDSARRWTEGWRRAKEGERDE